MDFTLTLYRTLLETLQQQGFSFQTFGDFIPAADKRLIILRHDVDLLPLNSLEFAKIEAEKGIKGTYYFRIVPESFDEKIIKEIHSLGHEIGYHYEDLSFAQAKLKAQGAGHRAQGEELEKQVVEIGIRSFKKNLEDLRKIVPVKTICMHGSPMSRWDSRLLWKYYDYRDFGIVGEPYFDINFDEVLYLTDTGRRWDGDSFNIRDKAEGKWQKAEGMEKKGRKGEGESDREGDLETKRLSDKEIVEPSVSHLVHRSFSEGGVPPSDSPSVILSSPPSALSPQPEFSPAPRTPHHFLNSIRHSILSRPLKTVDYLIKL